MVSAVGLLLELLVSAFVSDTKVVDNTKVTANVVRLR
jgi:hypothetical protein